MNEERCVCCGSVIPEGRQVCWNCEHGVVNTERTPSDAQIQLAANIANTLGIEFPLSSKDFTAAIYWQFIRDHLEEARSYWSCDDGRHDGLWDDIMWTDPLNQ